MEPSSVWSNVIVLTMHWSSVIVIPSFITFPKMYNGLSAPPPLYPVGTIDFRLLILSAKRSHHLCIITICFLHLLISDHFPALVTYDMH